MSYTVQQTWLSRSYVKDKGFVPGMYRGNFFTNIKRMKNTVHFRFSTTKQHTIERKMT